MFFTVGVSREIRCTSINYISGFFSIIASCTGMESSVAECGGIEEMDSCPDCEDGGVKCSPGTSTLLIHEQK